MYGKTDLILYPIFIITTLAALTDLSKGKIYNWLTLPSILLGLIACYCYLGVNGFWQSLLGIILGFLLYGWIFGLGFMGAGDVKLLMALGAWGGSRYVLQVGLLGIFIGGIFAFFILIYQGKIKKFINKIYYFMITLFIRELRYEGIKIDRKLTMPFGISIAIASILMLFFNPFEKIGFFI